MVKNHLQAYFLAKAFSSRLKNENSLINANFDGNFDATGTLQWTRIKILGKRNKFWKKHGTIDRKK